MAVIESTPAAVLPREPYGHAGGQQRRKSQRFSHAVVDRQLARPHFLALLQQLLYLGMDGKFFGISSELLRELLQSLFGHRSGNLISGVITAANIFVPICGKPAKDRGFLHLRSFIVGFINVGAVARLHLSDVNIVFLGEELKQRRVGVDLLIQQRLGNRGVVNLAVAMATVSDQVNHHVTAKLETVLRR